jgi:WD40 repeat protein
LCGLYNGNIEVWSKELDSEDDEENLFDSPTKKDRKIHRKTTLKDGHSGSVFCLAVNSDVVVSGSFDHSVCVWDRRRNFELLSRQKDRHGDMVYSVAINQLNQFVSCSHDSTG